MIGNAVIVGSFLFKKLNELKKKHPMIREVRGMGLMAGVELSIDGRGIYEDCLKERLLINCTQGHVLRLMPPLVVKEKEVSRAIQVLDEVMIAVEEKSLTPPPVSSVIGGPIASQS